MIKSEREFVVWMKHNPSEIKALQEDGDTIYIEMKDNEEVFKFTTRIKLFDFINKKYSL